MPLFPSFSKKSQVKEFREFGKFVIFAVSFKNALTRIPVLSPFFRQFHVSKLTDFFQN